MFDNPSRVASDQGETLRIGSLFTGVGGLDMAVEEAFGGTVLWHSEMDRHACAVLAHRFPHTPNLGDITKVDWSTVEPVDVICGGFPCQDLSAAGKQAGIKEGTRSGLWANFAEAIQALRPSYVVIENVRGILSGKAHRTVEQPDADLGEAGEAGRPVLRALGAVCGDLSDIGYGARWTTLAASAVGAPHRRERVFILATPEGAG
jgi:DNA (cytosine-5)-methyltransferase 1